LANIEDIGISKGDFKNQIKHFRVKILGYTQKQMAEEVMVSVESIRDWESGRTVPNQDFVIRRLVEMRFVGGLLK
jgi:ribosome-binding protein aMBF1 (putative translation factor)